MKHFNHTLSKRITLVRFMICLVDRVRRDKIHVMRQRSQRMKCGTRREFTKRRIRRHQHVCSHGLSTEINTVGQRSFSSNRIVCNEIHTRFAHRAKRSCVLSQTYVGKTAFIRVSTSDECCVKAQGNAHSDAVKHVEKRMMMCRPWLP